MSTVPHPPIVPRSEWLADRKKLLDAEKELTKQSDAVNAMRRRLPMVKLDKTTSLTDQMAKSACWICSRDDGS